MIDWINHWPHDWTQFPAHLKFPEVQLDQSSNSLTTELVFMVTNSNTLATQCEEPTHWKISWCWGRLRAGEGDDRGWDGWMASLTHWTWVWANFGKWGMIGKPDVLQFTGSLKVGQTYPLNNSLHLEAIQGLTVSHFINITKTLIITQKIPRTSEALFQETGTKIIYICIIIPQIHSFHFWSLFMVVWVCAETVWVCWSWNSNTLATWCKELTPWKRPWCWKNWRWEKGTTEDEMAGWHHRLNGHKFE